MVNADKLVHMGVYGLLTLLCYISLIHQDKFFVLKKYPLLFSIIICSIYGISDEIHQYFVPNRDSELWDWYADFAGVVIAVLVIRYFLSKKYKIFFKKYEIST